MGPYQSGYLQALKDFGIYYYKGDGDTHKVRKSHDNYTIEIITLPPEPSPWRPIEEAPKDGTLVDLWYVDQRMYECYFDAGTWRTWSGYALRTEKIKGFMLPPPGPEGE